MPKPASEWKAITIGLLAFIPLVINLQYPNWTLLDLNLILSFIYIAAVTLTIGNKNGLGAVFWGFSAAAPFFWIVSNSTTNITISLLVFITLHIASKGFSVSPRR